MVDFPSAVAVPSTGAYAPPQVDFSWLANLGTDYYKGKQNQFQDQQNQQTLALQQAFKGGIPTNPDGSINYQAMVQTLAQKGDISAVTQLAPLIQAQQNNQAAQRPDPFMAGAGGAQPQPQSALQAPPQQSGDLPPASAGLARPTGTAQPSGPSPSGPTVSAIVSSVVPNGEMAGKVSANIARALGVDPSTPLSEEQQARAVNVVRSYAQRRPQPAAQPGTQPGSNDQVLPLLQNAVFGQESSYGRNSQTSSAGAHGPMQIEPATFRKFASPGENIDNSDDNRNVGNKILATYLKQYNGDAARAAVAYYSGPGNVAPPDSPTPWKRDISKDKSGKPILPVSQYVDQVLHKMGTSALQKATAPAPVPPGQRVAQGFGMVPGMGGPAPQMAAQPSPSPIAGPVPPQGQPVTAQAQPAALPSQAAPAQFSAPGMAQPQQPAAPQQGGPIGPQIPLPPGFKRGQEPQAILALQQHAMELASNPNPLLQKRASFFENWAKELQASIKPLPVRPGEILLDPRDRSEIFHAPPASLFGRSGSPEMVGEIAQGIKDGTQPPSLTGLYGMSGPIRAQLAKEGFDLSKAQVEWQRAQRQITALNGAQMTRFVGLAGSVNNTIDEARELSQQMQLSGISALNKLELSAYIKAAGNTPNGQLATRYMTAINTLKEEFASLAQGGYAPHESAWALADQQINGNYGVKQLDASLGEVKRLINYRIQGIPGLGELGAGAPNRYTGQTGAPQQGEAPKSNGKTPAPPPGFQVVQ